MDNLGLHENAQTRELIAAALGIVLEEHRSLGQSIGAWDLQAAAAGIGYWCDPATGEIRSSASF
jgi:hypothetical protein